MNTQLFNMTHNSISSETELNNIFELAQKTNASDLHFESNHDYLNIRFRIDGKLQYIDKISLKSGEKIISRLKVLANLDIAERRLPQDGRLQWVNSVTESINFRVSTLPTIHGEKVVLRLLDNHKKIQPLTQLGFSKNQLNVFYKHLRCHQGLIIITGPTGAGKTVTLYGALSHLNQPHINISTVEDPVEIDIENINQVNIHNQIKLTFATALKALLRQDPDVMMVGEIRDFETADISIKAAQTGHLVLSSLHTNSAIEAIQRLVYLGIESFNIVDALKLIISQRLLRLLCSHCKTIDVNHTKQYANLAIYQAQGCSYCNQGYKGRIGIYETLQITPELKELFIKQKTTYEINNYLKSKGHQFLIDSGMNLVKQGKTSIDELSRVIQE